jgi:hypothetical protein
MIDVESPFEPCPRRADCPSCAGHPGDDRFDWSFVDGVYCISLRHRSDRARAAADEMHRVGLCGRVVFYRPVKDRIAKRGCWESHRAVALDARSRGLRSVLILEDDVVFRPRVSPETIRGVSQALAALPLDWMGFYLGHWARWAYPVRRHVVRCSSLCTHAYVASARLLDWLCDTPFDRGRPLVQGHLGGRGIDSAFAGLPGMYAFFPLIAVQRRVANDHMSAPRIRIRPLRKLALDLLVRSQLRELALAHGMGANEKLVVALAPVLLPGLAIARRFARSKRALPSALGADAECAPPLGRAPD